MRIAAALLILCATEAYADCVGRPSESMRGWKKITAWSLPGDAYVISYLCSGDDRKIVIERYMSRMAPEAHYISDITLPKLNKGELLIAGQCSSGGKIDPYVIPFGNYTPKGVAILRHAWRVGLPAGSFDAIEPLSVRCAGTR